MSRSTTIRCDVCGIEIVGRFFTVDVQAHHVGEPRPDKSHDVCWGCIETLPPPFRPSMTSVPPEGTMLLAARKLPPAEARGSRSPAFEGTGWFGCPRISPGTHTSGHVVVASAREMGPRPQAINSAAPPCLMPPRIAKAPPLWPEPRGGDNASWDRRPGDQKLTTVAHT